jgi:hypothetical protein
METGIADQQAVCSRARTVVHRMFLARDLAMVVVTGRDNAAQTPAAARRQRATARRIPAESRYGHGCGAKWPRSYETIDPDPTKRRDQCEVRQLRGEMVFWLLCGAGVVLAVWQYVMMFSSYTD